MNVETENQEYQLTRKLWGEDKTDDAIYEIYLKKVRYHTPSKSVQADPDDSISHLEWETVRVKHVKAGTLEKLVENLTNDDGEPEFTYMNIFFATYRTFSSVDKVLSLILDRYEKIVNNELDLPEKLIEKLKNNVLIAIRVWLDSYPDDFRDSPLHTALQQLIIFARQYSELDLYYKADHKLKHFCEEDARNNSDIYPLDSSLPFSTNGCNKVAYSFSNVPHKLLAEQLTRIDVDLFKKVVPHQCLGAVWARRDKYHSTKVSSVLATVNQFNAVSLRVITTILMKEDLKFTARAKIISNWIDVAQELRILKNFSSLKAIISALQSVSIHRLCKTWEMVPKEKKEIFQELAQIVSEENNQWNLREHISKEGTSKFAEKVRENGKHLPKKLLEQNNKTSINIGTVPYLGTYLKDLTMLDTANPDYIEGLINFDKRRKEFEILAQIKLLQGAANAYNIEENVAFIRWFDSIVTLDDKVALSLSRQIEPDMNNSSTQSPFRESIVNNSTKIRKSDRGHRKTGSSTSISSDSSSQLFDNLDSESLSPRNSTLDRKNSLSPVSISSSSSLTDASSNSNNNSNTLNFISYSPARMKSPSADPYIIRVTTEADVTETDGYILYKSIMLSNSDKTKHVIRNAMLKLGLHGNPEEYTLSQVSEDRELLLPDEANVYYAANPEYALNFILRKKSNVTKDKLQINNVSNKCTIKKHSLLM